jgi:hypothetical protein
VVQKLFGEEVVLSVNRSGLKSLVFEIQFLSVVNFALVDNGSWVKTHGGILVGNDHDTIGVLGNVSESDFEDVAENVQPGSGPVLSS